MAHTLKYKGVEFSSLYANKSRGPFIGPSFALVERGKFKNKGRYWLNNISKQFYIGDKLSITPHIYFKQMHFSPDGQIYPSGYGNFDEDGNALDINSDGIVDVFPDGMIAKYDLNDNVLGTEIISEYRPNEKHEFSLGISTEYAWISKLHTKANFNIIVPGIPYYLGEFRNFDNGIVNAMDRITFSAFAQDSWHVLTGAYLTLGGRFDNYSDFGSVFSPRIGFSHSLLKETITYKLLYGRAFRAPSFGELERANNANIIGNPDLKPEIMDTYEAGFEFKVFGMSKLNINYFFIDMNDFISRVSRGEVEPGHPALTYANTTEIKSQGFETEFKAVFSNKFNGTINYTYQKPEIVGENRNKPLADIPNHLTNLNINYKTVSNVNFNFAINYVGKRKRGELDNRNDLKAYTWSSFTIIFPEIVKKLTMSASVYNLFNTNYSDPGHYRFVPNDYPRPGINYALRLQYNY